MYFERNIDIALTEWANQSLHKPLLLRGARQTGKTTAVRNLARNFKSFVELNFEDNAELTAIFEGSFDIGPICAQIEALSGTRILPGETLLFLDEIQACPRAISALRYFYEKFPALHVVATGSLLEFAFAELSDFGVGRIRNMFVHPFSFGEYLKAAGDELLFSKARQASFDAPVPPVIHEKLLRRLKEYMIVGGMPAAVRAFVETGSFVAATREQDDILIALKSDFGKYKARVPPDRVRNTLASVIRQTGQKFTYTDSLLELSYRQAKECTDLLEMAKLIVRVDACHANGIPLGGDIDSRGNKFLFFDIGLFMRENGTDLSEFILDDATKFINRGKLAEMFAGLELVNSESPLTDPRLFYWHREAKSSSAEVDYITQFRNRILPIEVKAGHKGAMKSLRILMSEKGLSLSVRTSEENLATMDNIRIIPLYLIGELKNILGRTPAVPSTARAPSPQ